MQTGDENGSRETGERNLEERGTPMRSNKGLLIGAFVLAVIGLSAAAWGQEGSEKPAKVWQKKPNFSFRLGSIFSDVNSQFRVDGADGVGTVIDAQNLLNLPKNGIALRAKGDFRIAKWFGVEAEYYGIADSATTVLDRDITVGDEVFSIDETVSTSFTRSFLDTSLKFYFIHKPRLDLGLFLGANIHFMKLTMDAEPSGRSLYKNPWYPVPALGVTFNYDLGPRWYLYGKAGYFYYKVQDSNLKLDSVRFDINMDYYFWKSLGVGVTYEYIKSSMERDTTEFAGMISNRSSSFQIYLAVGF
jgi:hypothetical protein